MSETVKENSTSNSVAPKKSWWKGLKAEFKKIIWPDKKTIGKQTLAVVSVSIVLGLIIAAIDTILQFGINFLVK